MIYNNWKWCIKNFRNPFIPLNQHWYHIRKWIHWEFGLHKWEKIDKKEIINGKEISWFEWWCPFCGKHFGKNV